MARVTKLGEFSPLGRLFTLDRFSENNISTHNLWVKNGLGYIFGEFLTNSSGHPVHGANQICFDEQHF
jgi:hypothetical protein